MLSRILLRILSTYTYALSLPLSEAVLEVLSHVSVVALLTTLLSPHCCAPGSCSPIISADALLGSCCTPSAKANKADEFLPLEDCIPTETLSK